MILIVLLVIFAGLLLFVLIATRLFPRVAAGLHLSEGRLAATCVVLSLLFFFIYACWSVECPFCHAGHVDAQGRCRLTNHFSIYFPDWDRMSETDKAIYTGNPGHYRLTNCPWCGRTGEMSRLAIWLD